MSGLAMIVGIGATGALGAAARYLTVEWLARWQKVNYVGVAAGALLLTLGAPFWFHVLKDLLKLRSAMAGQESQDRAQRQAALTDSPPPLNGERGDL